jgi:hypothetical protein
MALSLKTVETVCVSVCVFVILCVIHIHLSVSAAAPQFRQVSLIAILCSSDVQPLSRKDCTLVDALVHFSACLCVYSRFVHDLISPSLSLSKPLV